MWIHEKDSGAILQIKVIPNAKQNRIVGIIGDFLKIKIKAVPEKDKANGELISYLAKKMKIPKRDIYVVRGQKQSLKLVFLPTDITWIKSIINS